MIGAKDIILAIIGQIGTAGGTGHVIEYAGEAIREALSMEGRMTVCNMDHRGGARAGLVAPDETTISYLKGRPDGTGAWPDWDDAIAYWRSLPTDEGAKFDTGTDPVGGRNRAPGDLGHQPRGRAADWRRSCPTRPRRAIRCQTRGRWNARSTIWGWRQARRLPRSPSRPPFIGSCTNGRIEDLRTAAAIAKGRKVADGVRAMVVPGSGLVKKQAEDEGLDRVFTQAGFEWREAGCSMCLAMNPDKLAPKERAASTSNRNFEGRQGPGGRTHLMSPAMVAAAAIAGHITDVRDFD